MMLFRRGIVFLLIPVMLLPVFIEANDSSEMIKKMVFSYFETVFNVPKSDIQLKILHMPKTNVLLNDNYRFIIESNKRIPRLGYQTLLLLVSEGQFLKERLPIAVDVSIYMDVIITSKNLKRGQIVTPEHITTKRLKVSADYGNLIKTSESVIGLMTKQVVREGVILRKSMVREAPDIHKGDEVKIRIVSGELVITTDGEVKEDGMIGEKVRVVCESTRKQLSGVIQSPGLVVVQLQ